MALRGQTGDIEFLSIRKSYCNLLEQVVGEEGWIQPVRPLSSAVSLSTRMKEKTGSSWLTKTDSRGLPPSQG